MIWLSSTAATWLARIRSRVRKSLTRAVSSRNVVLAPRSTWRVSQLSTGRGTITVPMMLRAEVSTMSRPASAAT